MKGNSEWLVEKCISVDVCWYVPNPEPEFQDLLMLTILEMKEPSDRLPVDPDICLVILGEKNPT